MKELLTCIHDDRNGLDYCLHGDYYFLEISSGPELKLGRYALSRLLYLRGFHSGLFNRLLFSGKFCDNLQETETEARRLLDIMIPQMAKGTGVDENLKAHDQMQRIGLMNCIKGKLKKSFGIR